MTPTSAGSWFRVLRAFWPDVRPQRGRLVAAYSARTLSVVATLLAPWPLKVLVDDVVGGRGVALGYGRPVLSPISAVVALTALFTVVMALGALGNALEKTISATIRERFTFELRDRLLAHFLTLSPGLRTRHRSGELVLRIVDDTDLYARVLTKTLPQVFQHALTLVGTLVAMAWIAPSLTLAGCILIPAVALVLRRDARRLWAASREKRTREGEVCGLAQEIVRGMAVIQAAGREREAREAFAAVNRTRVGAGRAETAVAVDLERTLQLLQGLAVALVTGGGTWFVLRGELSIGSLTLMATYVTQLLRPVEKLNDLSETTGRGMAGGERLLRLLEEQPAVADVPGARAITSSRGLVELRHVSFGYPDRDGAVLRDVSLALRPGELTVLVGPSGVGKSTLLSLLVRVFDPSAGEIRLDDTPLRQISLASLRRQFALLSQDTQLFAGTVRAAVAPSGGDSRESAIWDALARVSLDGFVRQLPEGLDTPLGEDGVNLSGGQRRRLALARAFMLRRPILLLDEPLANVDADSAAVILDAIAELRRTTTCFAVTHEARLVALADRVYRLVDGQLVEASRPTLRVLAEAR